MHPDFYTPSHKKLVAADRFWKRVLVKSSDECWLWLSPPDRDGYGSFYLGTKTIRAHRASWMLHFGEIPDGILVCHSCDNPLCVNPKHLFLGTNNDNIQDMMAKGRNYFSRGSNRKKAKITEADVVLIREMAKDISLSYAEIGEKFGVSAPNICLIVKGQTWKHVEGAIKQNRQRRNEKLIESDVREIRKLHEDGKSQAEIARQFKVAHALINRIIHRKIWTHV